MTIVSVGAGNLATNLMLALRDAGHRVAQVYSRTEASASSLAALLGCSYTTSISALTEADVYIYALKDDVIQIVAQQLGKRFANSVHLHTAGAGSTELLCQVSENIGVLYPFQTFSKVRIVDFRDVPMLVEGRTDRARKVALDLAESVSEKVYSVTYEDRLRLHLAGVLVNNFTNCLYGLAAEQLSMTSLPFDILLPLIDETAEKVHSMSPRSAQTGPAVRGDESTMQKHLDLIASPDMKELYTLLSSVIRGNVK